MYLCADVRGIAEGTSATIKIVEKDDDGNDDEVESPNTKIQNGKIKCKWKVVYMEDNDDTESRKEMEEKGYTLPEYAFTVECGGEKSAESGQLDIADWVNIKFNEQDFEFFKDCKFYIYTDDWESNEVGFDDKLLQFKEIPFLSNKNWKLGVR